MKNLYESILGSNGAGINDVIKQWILDLIKDKGRVWNASIVKEMIDEFEFRKESDGKYGIYLDGSEPFTFTICAGDKFPSWMSEKYLYSWVYIVVENQDVNIDLKKFKQLEEIELNSYDLAGDVGVLKNASGVRIKIDQFTCSSDNVDLTDFGEVIQKNNNITSYPSYSNNTITVNTMKIGKCLPDLYKVRCKEMIFDFENNPDPLCFKHPNVWGNPGCPILGTCIIDKMTFNNVAAGTVIYGIKFKDCKLNTEDLVYLKELCKENGFSADSATIKRSGLLKKEGGLKDMLGYIIQVGDIVAVADGNRTRFGRTDNCVAVYKVDKITDARISCGGHYYPANQVIILDKDWIKKRDTNNVLEL